MKLEQRLSVAILPAILGPLIILGVISFQQLQGLAHKRALENIQTTADQFSASIRQDVAAKTASIGFLAIASPLATYLSSEDQVTRYGLYQPSVLALFTDFQVAYPDNRELRLYDRQGVEDIAWLRGQEPAFKPADYEGWVRELRQQGAGRWQHVARAGGDGRPMLVVGTPLKLHVGMGRSAAHPEPDAFLLGIYDLSRIVSAADAIRFGDSGAVLLVDSSGRVMSTPTAAPEWVRRGSFTHLADGPGQGGSLQESGEGGAAYVAAVRELDPNMKLVAGMAGADVVRSGTQLALMVALLILLSILAVQALVYRSVKRVLIAPVQHLTQAARAMAGGDLKIPVADYGEGQLGELGGALRDLADGLSHARELAERRDAERSSALVALTAERDRAEQASRAKGEFLARMSHEIRTPMNGVLGMTELLRSTPLDERQKRFAEVIHHSADSLLGIINDVLDYSKIEAGKLELVESEFDLRQLVDDAVDLFTEKAACKNLKMIRDFPPALPPLVRGDGMRLRQTLVNLISNAVKFTDQGEVRIRLKMLPCEAQACRIRFEVQDTGIGIRAESQRVVFESFSQEDGTTTRSYGGTGLGLSISRELVALMGGEIDLVSRPGAGSTFGFTLQFALAAPAAAAPSVRQGEADGAAAPPPLCVLLVEDNPVNQEVARGMLESMGVQVESADNGLEALSRLNCRRFDAVLMDCHMPEMDGYEATRRWRQQEAARPGARRTPIIAVTANALEGDADKCREAGMDEHLSKPFTLAQLRDLLMEINNIKTIIYN
jgi:signal transduction histidine kinase/CheY-like chemotaxis protein